MFFEINSISKPALPNDLHDEFMKECAEIISAIDVLENEKFRAVKEKFLSAFAEEEKWFKQSTSDPALEELRKLSKERLRVYSGMRFALKGILMANLADAHSVEILLKYFKVYQRNMKTSVEGLTSFIRNLLTSFSQAEEQQALIDTQTMPYYNRLLELNEQVSEQKMRCRQVASQYVTAALRKARKNMDEVYDETVKAVEGLANLFGGSFERVIALWNTSIKKYKETLKARRAARQAAKKKGESNTHASTDIAPKANALAFQMQHGDWATEVNADDGAGGLVTEANLEKITV